MHTAVKIITVTRGHNSALTGRTEEEKNNHKLPAIYTKSKKKNNMFFFSYQNRFSVLKKNDENIRCIISLSPAGFLVYLSIVWMSPFLLSL
jgi:hypothetical protein